MTLLYFRVLKRTPPVNRQLQRKRKRKRSKKMQNKKRERLRGLDEIRGSRITLNNLELLIRRSTGEITKEHMLFQIMLMREELSHLEAIELETMFEAEIEEHKRWLEHDIENRLRCSQAPCHKCHHLNNGCYEVTREVVDEIEKRWEFKKNGQVQ